MAPGETVDEDGVIRAAPQPPTPRTRLERLRSIRRLPAPSAPVPSPAPARAETAASSTPAASPDIADLTAVVEEARAAFQAALEKDGVRDADA